MNDVLRIGSAVKITLFGVAFLFLTESAAYLQGEIAGAFLADSVISEGPVFSLVLLYLIPVFVLFLLIYWQMPRINKLSKASAKRTSVHEIGNRRYLITGFSPLYGGDEIIPSFTEHFRTAAEASAGDPEFKKRLPWQQNLRVIYDVASHHKLEGVFVLVPQKDDKPSKADEEQARAFIEFIEGYFEDSLKGKVNTITIQNGQEPFYVVSQERGAPSRHYEFFDYVKEGIDRGVEMIAAAAAIPVREIEREIVLDITSGLKVFSIVGAIQTLNRDLVFAYASNDGSVTYYDAEVTLAGRDGL